MNILSWFFFGQCCVWRNFDFQVVCRLKWFAAWQQPYDQRLLLDYCTSKMRWPSLFLFCYSWWLALFLSASTFQIAWLCAQTTTWMMRDWCQCGIHPSYWNMVLCLSVFFKNVSNYRLILFLKILCMLEKVKREDYKQWVTIPC